MLPAHRRPLHGKAPPKTAPLPEENEMEQFPEPPELQRSNAYVGEPEQSPSPGNESRDGSGKESTEDSVEVVPEGSDDAASNDDDVSETDGTESEGLSESEDSEYTSTEDDDEGEEETKDSRGVKRSRSRMSKDDIEETVRKFLNTKYLLSKKKDLLGDNFFL